MAKETILVVDDQAGVRTLLSLLCQEEGLAVEVAKHGLDAINKIKENCPAMVLMDVRMPVMDGVTALGWIKEHYPDLPVVMMTAYAEEERLEEAEKIGVVDVWYKPFDIDEVRVKVKELSRVSNS
ncbi:MAG: response regulator [Thermoanaerobacteraceae bacterium]|nr:response regulator [Thermoanaerobacteraceae bacterium]